MTDTPALSPSSTDVEAGFSPKLLDNYGSRKRWLKYLLNTGRRSSSLAAGEMCVEAYEEIRRLDHLCTELTQARAEIAVLRNVVGACGMRFRAYEKVHMEKGSIDGDVKARSNAEMAELCERALGGRDE